MSTEKENPTTNPNAESVISMLDSLMADEYVLYTKTKNAYWYMDQLSFMNFPRFMEKHVVALDIIIDDIAERVLRIRYAVPFSMGKLLKITRLREWDEEQILDSKKIIHSLVGDHEKLISILKEDIVSLEALDDIENIDFLAGLVKKHEQIAEKLSA